MIAQPKVRITCNPSTPDLPVCLSHICADGRVATTTGMISHSSALFAADCQNVNVLEDHINGNRFTRVHPSDSFYWNRPTALNPGE